MMFRQRAYVERVAEDVRQSTTVWCSERRCAGLVAPDGRLLGYWGPQECSHLEEWD